MRVEIKSLFLSSLFSFIAASPFGFQDASQTVLGAVRHESLLPDVFRGESWIQDGLEYVKELGLTYVRSFHPALSLKYQLRATPSSPTLCDPSVKQHSGYFDIAVSPKGKQSLFYWFFESRSSPKDDPLILWLNGGPGCSSTTGLLFELGPCRIANNGANTTNNEYSWNSHANIIFLDQPLNTGYSYSTDGSTINNTPAAAEDVWAFLQLFFKQYPEYAKLPFHIAAESYGGIFGPNFASFIHKKNIDLLPAPVPDVVSINLASLMIGNGLTDPLIQFASVPDFACDGPYAVWETDAPECEALRSKVPWCERLVQACYTYNNRLACLPASLYCWSQLFGSFEALGLNPYDVRKTCDREEDGDLCYKELKWIDVYLNKPQVKAALGVPEQLLFQSCNLDLNQAFMSQGDTAHNAAALLPPLLEANIRLLVYAGNADFMCNYIGNEKWVSELENPFHDIFAASQPTPWVLPNRSKPSGYFRSAGAGMGNLTFVAVYESGHMVPYDQPEAALDLVERWMSNIPLSQE